MSSQDRLLGCYQWRSSDRFSTAIKDARLEPHVLIAYSRGCAYTLHIRNLVDWYDLEALIAGLNTLLAERGSDLRYATLDPHCVPCSKVAAGPSQGLIEVMDHDHTPCLLCS